MHDWSVKLLVNITRLLERTQIERKRKRKQSKTKIRSFAFEINVIRSFVRSVKAYYWI